MLGAGSGLDSQVQVLARFLETGYIANWSSGVVLVYVEKSGSGLVRVLDSCFFTGFFETRYITSNSA